MLTISSEQFKALNGLAVEQFHDRLAVWLRARAEPARSMSNSELRSLIQRQQQRAAAHGIVSERGITKWCYLAVTTAERFDQIPAVDAFLRAGGKFTPARRLHALMLATAFAASRSDRGPGR